MTYLLDVNALVALGLLEHEFHQRVTSWTQVILQSDTSELATCSITELGFVRILSQAPQYGLTTQEARHLCFALREQIL
jgi:predicted nucleic acid-binding protein